MICPRGKISHNYECVDCVAENGEYQHLEGGSFCLAVNPGYELTTDENGIARKEFTYLRKVIRYHFISSKGNLES